MADYKKLNPNDPLAGIKFSADVGEGVFGISFPDLTFDQFEALFTDNAIDAILGSIGEKLEIDPEEFM